MESRLAPPLLRHRTALRRARDAVARARLLELQRSMGERILERSALVSLADDPANNK